MTEVRDCINCEGRLAVYCGKCVEAERESRGQRERDQLRNEVGSLKAQMEDVIKQLNEQSENVRLLLIQVDSFRELWNRAELDLQKATDVLGESWLSGGVSLAEGIRRKVARLEQLISEKAAP